MSEATTRDTLGEECHLLTAYLIGAAPDAVVVGAYVRAHQFPGLQSARESRARDRALLRIAHIGPRGVRAADAYAAVLAKDSSLRRKLALLVAILESRGPSAATLDTATGVSGPAWMAGVALHSAACALRIVAVACLLPLLRFWDRPSASPQEG